MFYQLKHNCFKHGYDFSYYVKIGLVVAAALIYIVGGAFLFRILEIGNAREKFRVRKREYGRLDDMLRNISLKIEINRNEPEIRVV